MKMSVDKALLGLMTIFALATTGIKGQSLCYRLDAAFNFKDTLFFIYGVRWMIGLNPVGREVIYSGQVANTGYNHFVSAAVGARDDDTFYLLTARGETGFNDFNNYTDYYPLYWSGADEALAEDSSYYGIDAAAERADSHFVYFAACQFADVNIYNMTYFGKGNISDLGLPCYVDAAWSSPDRQTTYITKGFHLWRWFAGADKVDGPYHLFSFYCHLSTYLCPNY